MIDPRFEYIRHQILLDYKTEKPNIIPKGQMTNQTPCNHRTPYKPEVQYYDEQMVIVNGVSYTRTEPTPIVIQEDENTIVVGGVKYQKIEDPKPETLYDALELPFFTNGYMFNKQQKEWICNVVEKWLPDDDPHDGEEYQLGWNACLKYLRENIK
jgi:hypothetical protein